MPGHIDRVGDHNLIANDAIMGYVDIGHDQRIFSDSCFSVIFRTSVKRSAFPDGCVFADLQGRFLTVKIQVLGNGGYHSAGKYFDIAPYPGAVMNRHIGSDPALVADGDLAMDHGRRLNVYPVSDLDQRMPPIGLDALFSPEFQLLEIRGNNGIGHNPAVFADPDAIHQYYVGSDP
jgi:hypothetical protein